ncbi:hypothetical protein Rs2_07014 [Raphanus sativus]|nr:hypothetical protein Rs2_07014 [Raphanus sativus]
MVNPSLYNFSQDHVRLYTYWSIEGSNLGCYDIICPGFVQVSKNIPLGSFLQPLSVYNGSQYDIDLTLYQDRVKGDRWFALFAYNHENVGYWPASLFKAARFSNRVMQRHPTSLWLWCFTYFLFLKVYLSYVVISFLDKEDYNFLILYSLALYFDYIYRCLGVVKGTTFID